MDRPGIARRIKFDEWSTPGNVSALLPMDPKTKTPLQLVLRRHPNPLKHDELLFSHTLEFLDPNHSIGSYKVSKMLGYARMSGKETPERKIGDFAFVYREGENSGELIPMYTDYQGKPVYEYHGVFEFIDPTPVTNPMDNTTKGGTIGRGSLSNKVLYNGRMYKQHVGKRGGKYILVGADKRKVYVN